MKGIQFVTDDAGKRTAVLISLAEWGEVWEDIYDIMVSESRKSELAVSWKELKTELAREENVRGTVRS